MRLLLLLLLAAFAPAQIELTVEVARHGRKLDPDSRRAWSGSGPYVYDRTRKLHFRAGETLAKSALSLTRHLDGLRSSPVDFVVIHADAEVDVGDLPEVLGRLQRQGWWTLAVRGDGPGADEGRRWVANEGPAILGLEVEEVGTPIDLSSGAAWTGVGRLAFTDRHLRVTLDGREVDDLEETLQGFHVLRPDAPILVRFTPQVRVEEVANALEAVFHAGFERRALERAVPWIGASGEVRILDIDHDGGHSYDGNDLFVQVPEKWPGAPLVQEWLEDLAEGMQKTEGGLPTDRILLRVHPSASADHVLSVMALCGHASVRIWRIDVAIAGLEAEYIPTPLPISFGLEEDPPRLPVVVGVAEPGTRVGLDRGEWSGKGPFLYGDDRTLRYRFAVDELTELAAVRGLLKEVAEIEGLRLVIEPGPEVVWGDLFPLIRAAHQLGIPVVFVR